MPAAERNFPLKRYLDQINTTVESFSFKSPDLYRVLWESGQIKEKRSMVYVSAPLTSGGAKRLETSVAKRTVFQDNARTVEIIADWLAEDNPGVQLFLPHHLEQKGWTQFDYNFFWFCFISGIHPDVADSVYRAASSEIDIGLLTNYQADLEERLAEWNKLYYLFEDIWRGSQNWDFTEPPEIYPLAALIQLPDSQISIGGQLEARTAAYFNIPIYHVIIDSAHPDVQERQDEVILFSLSLNGNGLLDTTVQPAIIIQSGDATMRIQPFIPMGDYKQTTLPGFLSSFH